MTSAVPPPLVTDLVFEFLERVDEASERPEVVLEDICDRWPSQATSLRDAIGRLAGTGMLQGGPECQDDVDEVRVGVYRLERRLGSGGMGIVHVARRTGESTPVALKMLRSDLGCDHEAHSRFRREIEVAARLDHPNIVRILDRGTYDGDHLFLAMELHEGGTLDRVVAAHAPPAPRPVDASSLLEAIGAPSGPTNIPKALQGEWWRVVIQVAREVARALAHAHARGVIHRDVKPSNVIVTPRGRTLLLDFGLASLRGAGRLTATGAQLGSLPYMSPEQVRGEVAGDVRVDVYALGVTLYELLALRLPFRGDDPARIALAIGRGAYPPASEFAEHLPATLARAIDAVIGCAMDVDPARRYASADAFAADLTALLQGRPVVARPPNLTFRARRWLSRRPLAAAAVVLALVAGIGGPAGYAVLSAKHSREMEASLEATLAHMSSLVESTDGGMRVIADGTLRYEPDLVAVRLTSTEKALDILRRVERDGASFLASEDPRVRMLEGQLRRARARLHLSRGDALYDDRRFQEALEAYDKHEAIVRRLVEQTPDDVVALRDLATCLAQQARTRHRMPDGDAALGTLEESIVLFEEAVWLAPEDPSLRSRLAATLLSRARALVETKDRTRQRASIERALELLQPIVASPDAAFADRRRRAEALILTLGFLEEEQGLASRLPRLRECEALVHGLAAEAPRDVFVQLLGVDLQYHFASSLDAFGLAAEASRRLSLARSALEGLKGRIGDEAGYGRRASSIEHLEAIITARSGEVATGVATLRAVVEREAEKAATRPDDRQRQLSLAVALNNFISQCKKVHPLSAEWMDEIESASLQALAIVERSEEAKVTSATARIRRSVLHSRGTARARAGRSREAARDADELEALTPESAPLPWVFLADLRAEIAIGMGAPMNADLGPASHPWDQALDALDRAVRLGLRDASLLRENAAFGPLQQHERFVALLQRIDSQEDSAKTR